MRGRAAFRACLLACLSTAPAGAGQLSLGTQADGWAANTLQPVRGWEVMVPVSVDLDAAPGLGLYAQTAFAAAGYTDQTSLDLTAMTDSVVGMDLQFQGPGLPAFLDAAVNLPTGDPSWEVKQADSIVPTEFLDTRYQGRGFGLSAMAGLAFPDGGGEWGLGAGYYHSGALNPDYGSVPSSEKLGDAFFLGLDRVETGAGKGSRVLRLSGMAFLTTQVSGADVFRMGPSLAASYAVNDPQGLSWEAGVQCFLPAARLDGSGDLVTESKNSFGQRFYLAPSLALGDWTLAGLVKYVTPNDCSLGDPNSLYDGGGLLLGLTPAWRLGLAPGSDLILRAGYDFVIHHNADTTRSLDVDYNVWNLGASYAVKI